MHQHRELRLSGTHHVRAPTTWAVLPDEVQPPLGTKRCGVLSLDLHDDGQATRHLVEPGGMSQHTLLRDVPDPVPALTAVTQAILVNPMSIHGCHVVPSSERSHNACIDERAASAFAGQQRASAR